MAWSTARPWDERRALVSRYARLAACAALAAILPQWYALPTVADDALTITMARLAGTVEVLHAELTAAQWIAAEPGQQIGAGWSLRTGEQSRVMLCFPGDNVVILRELSVLSCETLATEQVGLSLEEGAFLFSIDKLLESGSYEVQTPNALAIVRGTKFGVLITPADDDNGSSSTRPPRRWRTRFYGFRGRVVIKNERGEHELKKDYIIDALKEDAPTKPFRKWSEAREFLRDLEDLSPFEAAEKLRGAAKAKRAELQRLRK